LMAIHCSGRLRDVMSEKCIGQARKTVRKRLRCLGRLLCQSSLISLQSNSDVCRLRSDVDYFSRKGAKVLRAQSIGPDR
jgi:hypothetical protein